jgi:hypothetical protein
MKAFLVAVSTMSCVVFFRSVTAFSPRAASCVRNSRATVSNSNSIASPFSVRPLSSLHASSYEVDSDDQDAEQRLGKQSTVSSVDRRSINNSNNGDTPSASGNSKHRYAELLASVGLDDSQVQHVRKLPDTRAISPSDIFCNRELKLSGIRAIGFDMDYTLAQYQQPAFDKLAFDGAMAKLVYNYGYPEELLEVEYDHTLWTRGLIIDTQRGNFLKIDRHKYVRVANHGFDRISSTTRKHLYARTFNKVMSFSEKCKFIYCVCMLPTS